MIRGSIPCGRITGIDPRIHVTFLLLLGFIAWAAWSDYGLAGAGWSVAFTLSLFLCILLHELGHCWVARRFKVPVRSITLLPIGGVASMSRIPERPMEEFLVAVAGPLVNVLIAGFLILLAGGIPDLAGIDDMPGSVGELNQHIIRANIGLVLFNMIPAFPMDGGRVLRSVLAAILPYLTATTIAARIGQVAALVFVVKGFDFSPVLPIIGIFIFWAAGTEMRSVRARVALTGVKVRDLMRVAPVLLTPDDVLARCSDGCHATGQRDFAVMAGDRVAGILPKARWTVELGRRDPSAARVGAVMLRRFTAIDGGTDAIHLFQDQRFFRQKCFPVLESGRIAGFVDIDEMFRFVNGEDETPQPAETAQGVKVDLG